MEGMWLVAVLVGGIIIINLLKNSKKKKGIIIVLPNGGRKKGGDDPLGRYLFIFVIIACIVISYPILFGNDFQESNSTPTPQNKLKTREQAEIEAHINLKEYEFIYIQAGPSINEVEVGRIYDEETGFRIVGRSSDTNWIFVRLQNGIEGWVQKEFIVSDQALNSLPVINHDQQKASD